MIFYALALDIAKWNFIICTAQPLSNPLQWSPGPTLRCWHRFIKRNFLYLNF